MLVALNVEYSGLVLGEISAIAILATIAGSIYVNTYQKQLKDR